jgi:hypothetical protein
MNKQDKKIIKALDKMLESMTADEYKIALEQLEIIEKLNEQAKITLK